MDNVIFNRCQTPLKDLHLESYAQEVQEQRDYTVYKHTSPSGRVYVGITKLSLDFRWNHGRGYKRCKLFWRAIQKYGWENIRHEVLLEGITKSEAVYTEKYLIRWYKMHDQSYNITDGGESTSGIHMPEDAKRRISQTLKKIKGRPVLQYTLSGEFIREYRSAKAASEFLGYGKASVINCASGVRRESNLHGYIFIYKDNIDTLPLRIKWCEDNWRQYKIVQYKDGVLINTFNSIRGAGRMTGVNPVCIRQNIRGELHHAGGFNWYKIKKEDNHER